MYEFFVQNLQRGSKTRPHKTRGNAAKTEEKRTKKPQKDSRRTRAKSEQTKAEESCKPKKDGHDVRRTLVSFLWTGEDVVVAKNGLCRYLHRVQVLPKGMRKSQTYYW